MTVIYSFISNDKDKHNRAKLFLKRSFKNNIVVISFQVINEVTCNLKKKNFSEQDIKDIIKSFMDSCIVCNFTEEILLKSSELREKYKISFWDSLIITSSIGANCKFLYSEDMQNGLEIEGMKIINPFI
ncbi:MAG: PIN domain-containing protein [Candidatus Eremiobacterota bacterium]